MLKVSVFAKLGLLGELSEVFFWNQLRVVEQISLYEREIALTQIPTVRHTPEYARLIACDVLAIETQATEPSRQFLRVGSVLLVIRGVGELGAV